MSILPLLLLLPIASATTPRWAFVEGMDNVNDGDWLRDANNDWEPALNGTEAPFIEGLNAMFRATGDPSFLEEAVWHADGVMAQRNDARGVTDYNDEASPCWRDMHYTGGRPYCWSGHSGAIIECMLELALLIQGSRFAEQPAWDGETLGSHAQAYIDGAIETYDHHEPQWHSGGYYLIDADATFLGWEAGTPNPLNGGSTFGRATLLLYEATGDSRYLERVNDLAARWYDNIVSTPVDGLVWPYYSDDVIDGGEDIGHASTSLTFAARLWPLGIVIGDVTVERLANTLTESIYVDDLTMLSDLADGEENYLNYELSTHAWVPFTPLTPRVYPVVRNLFEISAPAEETTSGGVMRGWGWLAEHQPPLCVATVGEGWAAEAHSYTSHGDAILTVETDHVCLVRLDLDAPSDVTVSEGGSRVAVFQATGGERVRYLVAEGDTSFTLAHDASVGALRFTPVTLEAPAILSEAPKEGSVGVPFDYQPEAAGTGPYWWALSDGPPEARVDPATGALSWTPGQQGEIALVLRLDTDVGSVEQAYTVCVDVDCTEPEDSDPPGDDTGDSAPPEDSEPPVDDTAPDDTGPVAERPEECGCRQHGGAPLWLLLLALGALAARRRRLGAAAAALLLVDLVASEGVAGTQSAVQVTAGHGHSCALLDDGTVTCWGSNAHGQLEAPAVTFTEISAGWNYTCGITTAGTMSCWGDGGLGQTTPPSPTFHVVEGAHEQGVGITSFGAIVAWGGAGSLINTPPTGEDWEQVACGQTHCCAIDAAGAMECWGSNGLNGDPDGAWATLDAGTFVTCGIDTEGVSSCWGYGAYAPELEAGTHALVDLACGARHGCGVTDQGALECWGDNTVAGQLEAPGGSEYVDVDAGNYHSCAVTDSGRVACWGNNAAGQCDVPAGLR